jgi:hypothetical protein
VFVGEREEPELRVHGAIVAILLSEGCLEALNEAGRVLIDVGEAELVPVGRLQAFATQARRQAGRFHEATTHRAVTLGTDAGHPWQWVHTATGDAISEVLERLGALADEAHERGETLTVALE